MKLHNYLEALLRYQKAESIRGRASVYLKLTIKNLFLLYMRVFLSHCKVWHKCTPSSFLKLRLTSLNAAYCTSHFYAFTLNYW